MYNYIVINSIEETNMKRGTKNVLRVIISIIYIIWGIYSPISAIKAIIALNVPDIVSAAVSLLMLLAGILGLFGMRRSRCRAFGIVIFIFSVISIAVALPSIYVNTIITAILAWLFIICV